jgi:hypothetical protein
LTNFVSYFKYLTIALNMLMFKVLALHIETEFKNIELKYNVKAASRFYI